MSKKSKITKRELAAVLRESIFAPNKPGPLKVIVDVGDSRYYRLRALELVTLSLESPTEDQCTYYLEQAITLLAVAKHLIRTNQKEVNLYLGSVQTTIPAETAKRAMDKINKEAEGIIKEKLDNTPKRFLTTQQEADLKKFELAKLAGDPY